jgi:hypothetical protein
MLDVDALSTMIADIVSEEVSKAVTPLRAKIAELEAREPLQGPPGEKGMDGKDGEPGADGKDGSDGEAGKDGAGIADLLRDNEGNLVASFTDGRLKNLGPIQGADGKDGQDGFSLEDFDCVPVDERTIKMEFVRGETKHSYELQFPVVVYRGVFKEGEPYERGDMVTWGGSLWHCDAPTKEKPGTDSWTLAAKKGRDGKDLTKNG